MRRVDRVLQALVAAALIVAAGWATPSRAATEDRTAKIEIGVSPQLQPPVYPARVHLGKAQVTIRVSDGSGHPVHMREGELFLSWWDPSTAHPLHMPAPPTPMVPMGEMPFIHVDLDMSKIPGEYVVPVRLSRTGHWAVVFHAVAGDGSHVSGATNIIVIP